MKKLDMKKEFKALYSSTAKEVEFIEVPKLPFLMIDGVGEPESHLFQNAIQSLYALAYTLKFSFKREKQIDFPVMALEGIWWMKDDSPFDIARRSEWCWTLMTLMPSVVTKSDVKKTMKAAKEKKDLPSLGSIRMASYSEGLSAQLLHIGPYSTEAATIVRLHHAVEERNLELHGRHHEIYLGDPRRSKPEQLKTILRHPVRRTLLPSDRK
ncbi:MAG: GyrI-like domain-containing protein [bacterium]